MSADAEIYEALKAIVSKSMRLEARCDALEIAVGVLAKKANVPHEKLLKYMSDVTELSFQKRLERVEAANPAFAAEIDSRPELPELPDELLDS